MAIEITNVPKRSAPWIGIGVSGTWDDYRDALHDSQLDFSVISKPAKVEIGSLIGWAEPMSTITYEDVPGVKVNLVEGSNKILGCVSNQYGVIQNEDAFKLLEPLCDAGAVITHAGMTDQGLVFMVAEWSNFYVCGEEYTLNIMCTNSFNGNYPCGLIMTPRRIICQNMYRKIKNDQLLHVRHMSLAPRRIEEANANQERILNFMDIFKETMEVATLLQLTQSDVDRLTAMIFPYPKDPESVRYATSVVQIDQMREEFQDVYYCASDVKKFGASALRFVHAYYDYLSHGNMVRREVAGNADHKRLSRLVSGEGVDMRIVKELLK